MKHSLSWFIILSMVTVGTCFAEQKYENPVIHSPGLEPAGIAVGQSAVIRFSGLISGITDVPKHLLVEEIDGKGKVGRVIGRLTDDGKNGDHVTGDCVYTGWSKIKNAKAGFRHFRLRANVRNQEIVSSASRLWITDFPFEASTDENQVIKDDLTGEEMRANELLITFHEGVTENRIREIIKAENGEVLMVIPSLFIFHIKGTNKITANAVRQWATSFQRYPEIEVAEPNMSMGGFGEVSPSNKMLKPANPAQGGR